MNALRSTKDFRSKENFALSHTRPLLQTLNALNILQVKIYQHLNFTHRFKNNQVPDIFYDVIKKLHHKYPTSFFNKSFYKKKYP